MTRRNEVRPFKDRPQKKLALIAAIGPNRELGKNGKLLWHISEDLRRFRHITRGHVVIMGRKTFESIGKPLPERTNIIITRDPDFSTKGCVMAHSMEQAIILAKKSPQGNKEIFVIGGGQIYNQAMQFADKLYLTLVEGKYDADTYFPDYSQFTSITLKEKHTEGKYTFWFMELLR